jgi:hypothetical protein
VPIPGSRAAATGPYPGPGVGSAQGDHPRPPLTSPARWRSCRRRSCPTSAFAVSAAHSVGTRSMRVQPHQPRCSRIARSRSATGEDSAVAVSISSTNESSRPSGPISPRHGRRRTRSPRSRRPRATAFPPATQPDCVLRRPGSPAANRPPHALRQQRHPLNEPGRTLRQHAIPDWQRIWEALYYPSREPIILFCINAASAIKEALSATIGGSARVIP